MDAETRKFYSLCKKFAKSKMSIRQFVKYETNIPRSTFHDKIHTQLPMIDKRLYNELCEKLHSNRINRHKFSNDKNLK